MGGGYGSGAGGFASGFESAFSTTLNTAMAMKRQQLQEQSNKIAQYGELGKLKELWEKNPDVARPITKDFLNKMEIDGDTQKTWLDAMEKSGNDFRSTAIDTAIKLGLKPDGPTLKQIMSNGPSGLFQMGNDMQKLDANNKVDAALNGPQGAPQAGDAGTAAPPAPAAAPTPAPAASPAPDTLNAAMGAGGGGGADSGPNEVDTARMTSAVKAAQVTAPVPALPDVTLPTQGPVAPDQTTPQAPAVPTTSPAMPPAMQTAVGAPPATAMPGMPPGGSTPDATHSVADKPAYDAASAYQRYMNAANTLEARNPDRAKDLRTQAETIAKGANVMMRGDDPRVKGFGFKPGAVIQWNAATHEPKVVQEGQNSWTMLDPKDPKYANLYANQTPGTLIGREDQTGNIGVKVTGANMFKPATPAQLKSLNIDPNVPTGTSITIDSTGKPTSQQLVPEQEIPLTTQRRAEINAAGGNLDPNHAYSENLTTKKVSVIPTGTTAETERVALTAKSDQKELDEQRDNLTKSAQTIATNKVVRDLVQKYGTGPAGDIKLLAGQLADQFGVKMPKGLDINTAEGEALRATLGNKVVDQAMGLAGQKSAREMQLLKQNSGSLLLTPGGNTLITKISDWAANQSTAVGNLANNWEGPLTSKAASGPYAGKNYYQAKAEILSQQGLPPELSEGIKTETNRIKEAKAILPTLSTASADDLALLKEYKGIMTLGERKKARARAIELGVND